jgi:hypothetical protein
MYFVSNSYIFEQVVEVVIMIFVNIKILSSQAGWCGSNVVDLCFGGEGMVRILTMSLAGLGLSWFCPIFPGISWDGTSIWL